MDNSEKVLNPSSATTEFPFLEEDVARITGLTAAFVKAHRKNGAGCIREAKVWRWSAAGVEALEMAVGKKNAPSERPEPPAVDVLTVARVRTPRVLHVTRAGEDYDPSLPLALVLPQPFGMFFVAGMKVAARQRPGAEHVFDYAGNPDKPGNLRTRPRRVGMW